MVNFMYDFINRFINYPDRANEESLDKFYGTTNWRDIRNAADREAASVDLYKEQLRTTGAYPYVTSTRILKPLHDRAYFHLIYATRNPKGIIKFRDVERQTVKEQEWSEPPHNENTGKPRPDKQNSRSRQPANFPTPSKPNEHSDSKKRKPTLHPPQGRTDSIREAATPHSGNTPRVEHRSQRHATSRSEEWAPEDRGDGS